MSDKIEIEELKKILTELMHIPKTESKRRKLDFYENKENPNKIVNIPNKKALNTESFDDYKSQEILYLKSELENLKSENIELKKKVVEQRNTLINEKGLIRVICRIKPGVAGNNIFSNDRIVELENKKFYFDRIFNCKSKQSDIYEEIKYLVESVMDGYNICIFAYGQTGSGKTYTMEGEENNCGIIYRSLESIKEISKTIENTECKIEMQVKYVEIYNETIRDLIGGEKVEITHVGETVVLNGCKEVEIADLDEISEIVKKASAKRACGETKCNSKSSRSHSVFILKIKQKCNNEVKIGSLILIDLAGSERLQASKAVNERLKEAQNINKSLSALGNVFNAIKRKNSHIPFRDSKLTHLMKNYLTGKSRTTMILNINPDNISESMSSLRFGASISDCSLGGVKRNVSKFADDNAA